MTAVSGCVVPGMGGYLETIMSVDLGIVSADLGDSNLCRAPGEFLVVG